MEYFYCVIYVNFCIYSQGADGFGSGRGFGRGIGGRMMGGRGFGDCLYPPLTTYCPVDFDYLIGFLSLCFRS